MRKGQIYYRKIQQAYARTYFELGLGYVITPQGEKIRNGFLYQEPNPDYDKGLIENCEPVLFEDGLPYYIPADMPKPKVGPKGNFMIQSRPIVCIETGEFFTSAGAARKAGHPSHCDKACKEYGFSGDKRYTYVDPFMEDNHKPWPPKGFIKHPFKNKTKNNTKAIRVVDTGEVFEPMIEFAKKYNVSPAAIRQAIKRNTKCAGHTIEIIKKELR